MVDFVASASLSVIVAVEILESSLAVCDGFVKTPPAAPKFNENCLAVEDEPVIPFRTFNSVKGL